MKTLEILRKFIRYNILKEEIGRNYHTLDTDPYTWEDYTDVIHSVYVDPVDGTYVATVTCKSNPELSSPEKKFKDEASATHWARMQADICMRKSLNQY